MNRNTKPNRRWAIFQHLIRGAVRSSLMLGTAVLSVGEHAQAQRIFTENFEELTLGPNVEEGIITGSIGALPNVWTSVPPAGWTQDNSRMPGFGDPANNGVLEWSGFTFANRDWWVRTAGDQRRSEFVLGTGTVMVADNDEWDDLFHTKGFWDATITTKDIDITGVAADSLLLAYDSSWRPEAKDDGNTNPGGFPVDANGNQFNDQTAFISATFDTAAPKEVQRWTSVSGDETFHDHFPNETVLIPLKNPAGSKKLALTFGMEKAANDWWWALDNIAVGIPPFLTGISADGVSFSVRIVEALGKTVDRSKGVVVELDGKPVTPVDLSTSEDGNFLVVRYSQAPEIFQPKTKHTVRVKFTNNAGKAIGGSTGFTAPSYTTVTSTPIRVTTKIQETDWLKVGASTLDQLKLELDGKPIAPASVVRNDADVTIRYDQTVPFEPNSVHSVKVVFVTATGKQVTDSASVTIPNYATLPTWLATAAGTGTQPGMRWRTHQLGAGRPANNITQVDNQLKGTLGASIHDTSGQEADGFYNIAFVNFESKGAEAGSFKSSGVEPLNVDDATIPGIPGTKADGTESFDNVAAEAVTFLNIPAPGVYTMRATADDGAQVSVGTKNSPNEVIVGGANSDFYFKVDKAGVYLFRLAYWQNGGGAHVEWTTKNSDDSLALVGGTQPNALQAFRLRTIEPVLQTSGVKSIERRTDGKLAISYSGTLKSSAKATGPYEAVGGATSPFPVTPSDAQRFFRAE